jgi:hypothetical protein
VIDADQERRIDQVLAAILDLQLGIQDVVQVMEAGDVVAAEDAGRDVGQDRKVDAVRGLEPLQHQGRGCRAPLRVDPHKLQHVLSGADHDRGEKVLPGVDGFDGGAVHRDRGHVGIGQQFAGDQHLGADDEPLPGRLGRDVDDAGHAPDAAGGPGLVHQEVIQEHGRVEDLVPLVKDREVERMESRVDRRAGPQ